MAAHLPEESSKTLGQEEYDPVYGSLNDALAHTGGPAKRDPSERLPQRRRSDQPLTFIYDCSPNAVWCGRERCAYINWRRMFFAFDAPNGGDFIHYPEVWAGPIGDYLNSVSEGC